MSQFVYNSKRVPGYFTLLKMRFHLQQTIVMRFVELTGRCFIRLHFKYIGTKQKTKPGKQS